MQLSYKKLLPHIVVFLGFVVLSIAYFSPVLQGKEILQSDIVQYNGMAKQQRDFKAQTGEETYWTNSAFGGMPTYQLGAKYPHNYIKKLDLTLRFLPRPADYLFLYFIGFYILLLCLKIDFKLAALGALAFGFSTYLIIILGVGHNSKAHAIAYMPLVISGIILTFRRKYILGFIITALAMGLQLVANHFQMTYYLLFLVIIIGVVYFIDAYKKKLLAHYFKAVGLMVVAVIFAIGMNATNILATSQYTKESTRGKSELIVQENTSSTLKKTGLPYNKVTEYSYGFLETFNLYIPRLLGGGMSEDVGKDSAFYKFYISQGASPLQAKEAVKNAPMYWGKQPIVEAPAYIGAVVLFLFVFALFLVKGRLKWWLVSGVILSLLLSYGKNLDFLTRFFYNYIPLYNKFRAVTSIQVILELCIPVLAIFGLTKLFNDYEKDENKQKALQYTVAITAGLAVLFLAFRYLEIIDFKGINDTFFKQNYGQDFLNAIIQDRQSIFTKDTIRTLIFVLLSGSIIYAFIKKKLSENNVVIAFALLLIFDLVGVDRRYVNTENFVASRQVKQPFNANAADVKILSDKTNFRVLDLTSSGAKASFFHNSLSGYHAAKLNRYNEVFDFYISRNNTNVLNMLNTKYIIAEGDRQEPYPYINEDANGNAWFIKELQQVNSANQEIKQLDSLDNKRVAVIDKREIAKYQNQQISFKYKVDSLSSIKVLDYKPNYIKYESENINEGFAVFSEIYYKNGWKVYINQEEVLPIYRVNYVLRGLQIPKGKHIIEFKFNPDVVKTGSTISLASSIVMLLLIFGGVFYGFKHRNE